MVLPSEGHSRPAAEDIQSPGSVLEEAGAGTGHQAEAAQGTRPACELVEARLRHQVHLLWWEVAGEPVTRAAEWMAGEVGVDPGSLLLVEGQKEPGWGEPCPNRSC